MMVCSMCFTSENRILTTATTEQFRGDKNALLANHKEWLTVASMVNLNSWVDVCAV